MKSKVNFNPADLEDRDIRFVDRWHGSDWRSASYVDGFRIAPARLYRLDKRERVLNGLGITSHALSDPERARSFLRSPLFDPKEHYSGTNYESRARRGAMSPFVSFADKPGFFSLVHPSWFEGDNVIVEAEVLPGRYLINITGDSLGERLLLGGLM